MDTTSLTTGGTGSDGTNGKTAEIDRNYYSLIF